MGERKQRWPTRGRDQEFHCGYVQLKTAMKYLWGDVRSSTQVQKRIVGKKRTCESPTYQVV